MPAENIAQRINALSNSSDAADLRLLLNAIYDAVYAIATRLDNDVGVTDTAYRSDVTAIVAK